MSDTNPNLAVEQLLAERAWLRALARSIVRDEHLADDLEQDVWRRILSRPLGPVRNARAWLRRVFLNRWRDSLRSEKARSARERIVPERRPAVSTADLVAEVDAQRHVVDAVLELEEPVRTTVLLRYFEDLPVREVARRMEVPYETARARLNRALENLRGRLRDRDGKAWMPGLMALAGLKSTGGKVAGTTLIGGAIVAAKTKTMLILAVLLLLVGGLGVWQVTRPVVSPPDPGKPKEGAPESGPGEEQAPVARTDPDEPGIPSEPPDPDPTLGSCHGRITYTDGQAVAGVPVRLSGTPSEVVLTDGMGRFHISNAWIGKMARSLWVGPRTGAVSAGDVALLPGEDVAFEGILPRGIEFSVQVFSTVDGAPLESIRVLLEPITGEGPDCLGITTSDGRCAFSQLPNLDYRILVDSEEWRPHRERLDPDKSNLRIWLQPPERLVLRADPPAGEHVRVQLALVPESDEEVLGRFSWSGRFSDDGTFTTKAPPPGRYLVYLSVTGSPTRELGSVEVRDREPVEIRVVLPVGVAVSGRLEREDGSPLVGTVLLQSREGAGTNVYSARTGEDGRFRVGGLSPGRYGVTVQVGRQQLRPMSDDLVLDAGGESQLRLTLMEGATITGRVVRSPAPGSHFVSLSRFTDGDWRTWSSLTTARDGSFTADFLPPGRWRLRATSSRPEHGWAPDVEVDLSAGGAQDKVEVQWRPNPEVTVVVTGAEGAPATGRLTVTAYPVAPTAGAAISVEVRPDENGRFVLRQIPPGRWGLRVTLDSAPRKAGETEVEVEERGTPPVRLLLSR